MVTSKTRSLFAAFAKHSQQLTEKAAKEAEVATQQKAEEKIKMKEREHKLEIQEKELRIRELEVKSKSHRLM